MASTKPSQSQFPERKSLYFMKSFVVKPTNATLFLSFVVNVAENRIKMRRQQLIAKAEVCGLFIESLIKYVAM